METNKNEILFQRNPAIDILRALTVLLMIFVNHFWAVSGVPQWMQHAGRSDDFLGLADVVFPVFLFVVGMSIPYAIENRFKRGLSETNTFLHIFSRFFALLVMGAFIENSFSRMAAEAPMNTAFYKIFFVVGLFMVWNAYPKTDSEKRKRIYTILQVCGVILLAYLAFIYHDQARGDSEAIGFFRGRYGILGSIAWSYLACAFVYMFVRNNVSKIFYFWLGLLLYCVATTATNTAEPFLLITREANILRSLMGIVQIGGFTFMTMGGVLFTLLLVKYSDLEARKRIIFYASLTAITALLAIIAHQLWIISKPAATPTWLLYCVAITIAVYGLLQWAISAGKEKWFNIIKAGGTATLSCYLIQYFMESMFYSNSFVIHGIAVRFPKSINALLPEFMQQDIGGVIKCIIWAFLCVLFVGLLERYKIKLKI